MGTGRGQRRRKTTGLWGEQATKMSFALISLDLIILSGHDVTHPHLHRMKNYGNPRQQWL